MAVVHMDDFAGYGTEVDLLTAGVYAGLFATSIGEPDDHYSFPMDPDGISGKRVLLCHNTGQNVDGLVRKVLPSPVTTIGMSARVWFNLLPTGGWNYPLVLLAGGVSHLFSLTVGGTGTLQIRSGDPTGTILYESTGPAITAQGWWHIEWKTVISETVGSFEVRVEGIPVPGLVQQNINTGTTAVQQAAFGQRGEGGGFGFPHYQKDFVVWTAEGDGPTDFIGTAILHRHSIASDAALNWTAVGGADGAAILNNNPPDPNQYIYAEDDPIPAAYRGKISPLPEDIVSIKAVQLRVMAAKNDGGDASLQNGLIADPEGTADQWNGAERPLTIAQLFWDDYNHLNPKTGAAWLPSELDEVEVYINRTL